MIIDYCDVLVTNKSHLMTEYQKQLIKKIDSICKDRKLNIMVVDSELTTKNKKVVWKFIDNPTEGN